MAKGAEKALSASSSAELLSYIINVTPELRGEIDLPVQGQSIKPIGQVIINNQRYKNAFINTVNLIGLTVIKRNGWDNPWDFTKRGTLRFGQQIREIVNDLCNVYDYNTNFTDVDRFLDNVVPNVFNYMHEVNFQKFYQTTTSDAQMAMAFETEDLFTFIDDLIGMLYESLKYDTYIVDKYQLCRRILDGTLTSVQIANYSTLSNREKVSAMKSVSNKLTFRSPNYNPAGIRKATSFDDQILIVNTEFEADFSTDVMATSFFRDEADMRARMVLIDGFENHDTARLAEVLGSQYVSFSDSELSQLANIPAVLISKEWFMDYDYALDAEGAETKTTEFFNPSNLTKNVFLHVFRCFSTSPFENAVVFGTVAPSITSVTVSPATATVSAGQTLQLSATVVTAGFANKAVYWSVDATSETAGVKISDTGVLSIPSTMTAASTVTVTATSIYDKTVTGTATITTA